MDMKSQQDDVSQSEVSVRSATAQELATSDFSNYMYPSVALQKWAGVFDGPGLCLPELKAETRAAHVGTGWPDEPRNSNLKPPNVKTKSVGTPIELEKAKAGPRSLILCVNAYVMKHFVFNVPEEEEKIIGRAPPIPTPEEQTAALAEALSDILWKLATSTPTGYAHSSDKEPKIVISIPGTVQCFETLGYLLADGLIEKAFHNLILNGSASCFLHNGTIQYDRFGNELSTPLVGLRKRSEIGFLFFDKTEEDSKRTEVGCMLRTPLLPIWITKVNGSYGMLFCTSRDLVADWKTERFFSVHYYTGHFSQEKTACISIDTRRRAFPDPSMEISYWDDEEEKERKQPSLERLLGTKWPDALLDWNGDTPYY